MRTITTWIWFFGSMTLVIFLNSIFSTGCANLGFADSGKKETESISIDQGGTNPILQMPVQVGKTLQCTQGAFGNLSHETACTKYDVDFDTSNTAKEELFAPISGMARVHKEDASKNFGFHICIDLGNGYYVILGHMSDILVEDGQEVAVGQLIGHEGCTGYCSGDHVHVGLHKGDAAKMGEFGESVPVSYLLVDKTTGGSAASASSTSLVCGIKALGDPVDGHFYTSTLPVARWHPDGSLVKTPVSSIVYRIDAGQLRNVETQDIFWSYHYDFKNVLPMSEFEYSCYSHDANVNASGLIDAFYDSSNVLWLVNGPGADPNRYRVKVNSSASDQVLASWGLNAAIVKAPPMAMLYESWPVKSGFAPLRDGTLVRDVSHSDVYVISDGYAVPVGDWNTFLLLGYRPNMVRTVEDGVIPLLSNAAGNCANGLWCLNQDAIGKCGGGLGLNSGTEISISSMDGPDSAKFDDPDLASYFDDPDSGSLRDAAVVDAGSVEKGGEDASASPQPDTTVYTSVDAIVQIASDIVASSPDIASAKDVQTIDVVSTPVDPTPQSVNPVTAKDDVLFTDEDLDGVQDTLLISQFEWLKPELVGKDAFVYGIGGCFDGVLTEDDRVKADSGYYRVHFSQFKASCIGELSLISSIGTNGQLPNSIMTNWYWWQNAPFCSTNSSLCQLQKNGTPWEEWLLRVSWDPASGLSAAGNAFTKNAQLK